MAAHKRPRVDIIGAGLVGSLIALDMQVKGYQVTVYERYADMRSIPSAGRSINLILTARGLRALQGLGKGLVKDMHDLSVKVTGRIMHQTDGTQSWQQYGKDDSEYNLSISRYELNCYLMNKAEAAGATLHYDHALTSADFTKGANRTVLNFEVNGKPKTVVCDYPVLGADGGGSRMRYAMRDHKTISFVEEACVQGYKEIGFPKGPSGGYAIKKEGLHIWPRTTHFLMALANLDGSFTGTIYIDKQGGEDSFEHLSNYSQVEAFFKRHYADAIPLLGGMDRIVKQMLENPVGFLGTVRASHYHLGSQCLLVGDAAHAITPFFGQGTNASFEDCLVLSQLLSQHAPSHDATAAGYARAFELFSAARKPNADAIAEMALDNFVEMRDRVGDPAFLLRKEIENALENRYEDRFRSRYAMVCYGGGGNITYDAALKLGEVQWGIVDELARALPSDDPTKINWATADRLIRERLEPLQRRMQVDLTQISHNVGDEDAHGPAARL